MKPILIIDEDDELAPIVRQVFESPHSMYQRRERFKWFENWVCIFTSILIAGFAVWLACKPS